jgi:hypothetical protein
MLNVTSLETSPYFRQADERIQEWKRHDEDVTLPDSSHPFMEVAPQGAASLLRAFLTKHRCHNVARKRYGA